MNICNVSLDHIRFKTILHVQLMTVSLEGLRNDEVGVFCWMYVVGVNEC